MPTIVRPNRAVAAVLTAATLSAAALVASSCSSGDDQPGVVAGQFVDALNAHNAAQAGAATSDPAKSSAAVTQMFDALGQNAHFEVQQAGSDDSGGSVTLSAHWELAGDAKKVWNYTTTGRATETDQGWRITWNPSLLAPGLTDAAQLRFVRTADAPARVLDRTGKELLTEQVVTLVNVDRSADVAAVAGLLAPVAPDITAQSLRTQLDGAQGKPITAVSLRDSDLAPRADALRALPGVTLAPQKRLLSTDRTLTSPVFGGLAELWQQNSDAAAGWSVEATTGDGTVQKLVSQDPKPTPDIRSTVDLGMEAAARAALAPVPQRAAIVAIQPSTGDVMAVAQNAPADAQGPIALTGLYPPGSTFKIATTSAALQAGVANPDTVLACPGTANIEGRQIPNDENFDLGQVPLHTAFARSCNTTMARLGVGLAPDAMTKSAAQLGLGIDYVTPGLTTVTGNVPPAATPAERVETAIGQGKVTASPFGMALLTSSIAHGSVPAPTMVAGQPGVGDRNPDPLPANVAEQIRSMMAETVSGGTATSLRDIGGLIGKTGTAEFVDNTRAHGWFVGIRGDLAFAVFVEDAGSSQPALDAAGRFLR